MIRMKHEIGLFNVLNDEFAAGLIGLVPAHIIVVTFSSVYPHAWSAVAALLVGAIFWLLCFHSRNARLIVTVSDANAHSECFLI